MFKRNQVAAAALAAMGASLLATSLPALAQSGGDRVEITGSLIRRIDAETALPVTTLKADDLAKVGVTNAEQVVKYITQQQGGTVTSGSVSGTNGAAAFADLRSLGANRTLVLLGSKRVSQNPFAVTAVDLNTLPTAALERVETLSDGASATYGTDAIAGVVNFLTRKTYKGYAVDGQAQVTQHGGADVYTLSGLAGWGNLASDGWNAYVALNYRNQNPMNGTEREFMKTSYQPDKGFNATSPTTFPANYSQGSIIGNPSLASGCAPALGSIAVPEASGSTIRCFADTQMWTNVVPEQEQWGAFLRGSYALGPNHTASLEYFKSYNRVQTQIAPSPEGGLTMFPTSPYYPGNGTYPADPRLNAANPISIGWRTVVVGPRQGEQENNTQRAVASIEGTLADWDYQASLLWSNAKVENFFLNGYPMTQPLRNGVSSCAGPLVGGACTAGPLIVGGQQLWLNPFGDQTAAGQAYILSNQVLGKVQEGESTLTSLSATASRNLGKLDGGPIALALGAEFRKEEMVYKTDIAKVSQAASSGLAGSGALREGDRDVSALVAEVSVPVMKNLEFGLGVRYDNYSDFGSTTNPKVSARWNPTNWLMVRGSANTGFSAPTLYTMYLPNSTTFTSTRYNDPLLCPGGVVNTAAGGVASRDCGIQFQQMQGGNAKLDAEESKAWTIGFVTQPMPTLSVGLDYWSYKITSSVSTVGEQSIFADPVKYANLYVRCSQADPARRAAIGACQIPGGDPLAYVINTFLNLGDVETGGIDFQVNWNPAPPPYGRFGVSLRSTYVTKYEFQVEPGGRWYEPVGNYLPQFGGPVIRYQQVTMFNWDMQDWSSRLAHRWQSGYVDQNAQGAPFNVAPYNTNKVGDYSTFDLSVSYRGFKGLTLTGGILNLFDTDPPFTNQTSRFQARGYDDRFHNPNGRTFQLAARYDF